MARYLCAFVFEISHWLGVGLSLVSPQQTTTAAFGFAIKGPPAAYTIFSSPDLAAWNELGTVTNAVGAVVFTDVQATKSPQKFYPRVWLHSAQTTNRLELSPVVLELLWGA